MGFTFVLPLNSGAGGGGGGTVTSVGVSMPSGEYNIANSPITGSGTINITYKDQLQNLIFASPNGATGAPSFRSIVGNDLPDATTTTKGALPIASNAEALAGTIDNKIIVPSSLIYTIDNYQIGSITPNNNSIASNDTINSAFAKAQGQINAKQNQLTFGNVTGAEFSFSGGTGAVIGSGLAIALEVTGVSAGTYGSSTNIATFTVDSKGRITNASNTAI